MHSNETAANEQQFRFAEKRAKLDWKALDHVDIARLEAEVDIDKMERMLQNLTFAALEKPDLKRIKDKNLIKLFKLG